MPDIKDEIKQNAEDFLPQALVRIVNTSVEKNLSGTDLLEIIDLERIDTSYLMRSVNNGRQLKINTPAEAMEILGPEQCSFIILNRLLSSAAGKSGTDDDPYLFEMQLFTASAAYILASESGIAYPENAYISGLLSNISYFYLSKHHSGDLKKILSRDKSMVKRMTYEWEAFGLDHAEMSYLILGSAGVMPEIYNPVRYHHQKNLQQNLGSDHVKDISLAVYFGSMLTNMFYDDLGLVSDIRKDIKNMMGLYANHFDNTVELIIDHFKVMISAFGIESPSFPGYFRIISWFDTKMAMMQSEMDIAGKKNIELNLQNAKYQKALEESNKKLVGIALTDPLTGAYNRRYMDERLHDEFQKAKRYGQGFTLISCDIDHFKRINDNYGHAFGDIVLVKIVQLIKNSVRKSDYVARTGGEEFVVVCHYSGELGGIIIAEKIRKTIESSDFSFEGKKIPVTMSFGVADYFPDVKSAEELLRISDDRLYAAKNAGRNKVIYK